jgi:hypothetical protein
MEKRVSLGLLRNDFTLKNYDGLIPELIAISAGLGMLPVLYYLQLPKLLVVLLSAGCYILLAISLRKILPDWVWSKDVIGEFVIDSTSIRIHSNGNERTWHLSELKKIEILSDYYRGFTRSKDIKHNGVGMITLNADEKDISYKFFIKDKEEYNRTNEVLKEWYRMQLPLYEYSRIGRLKGFLLRSNLNYAEMQKLKEETYQTEISKNPSPGGPR